MTKCPECGSRDSVWHRGIGRQMCNACGHHWRVVRSIHGFTLDLTAPLPEQIEAVFPDCCAETPECCDRPCYCTCARCTETRRCAVECTCDFDAYTLWLRDDCPYHDEAGQIRHPVTCPANCRCARCVGFREIDAQ